MYLWGEALMHAAYLRNRTTTQNTHNSTPYEHAANTKPNLAELAWFDYIVHCLYLKVSILTPSHSFLHGQHLPAFHSAWSSRPPFHHNNRQEPQGDEGKVVCTNYWVIDVCCYHYVFWYLIFSVYTCLIYGQPWCYPLGHYGDEHL